MCVKIVHKQLAIAYIAQPMRMETISNAISVKMAGAQPQRRNPAFHVETSAQDASVVTNPRSAHPATPTTAS